MFVLAVDGKSLTPTTPAKARKLLQGGAAKKVWSKFNTFGVQLVEPSRTEIPATSLGYDGGTKFEGFSVIVGEENVLNIKLDLPDKSKIRAKLADRSCLRRSRRQRKCRRRESRTQNRRRQNFLAPSQAVVVQSRLKVLSELCRLYPVTVAGIEDVRFNHAKHRWGRNFSTVEIGKTRIRRFFADRGIGLIEFRGFETQELRKQYGYRKTKDKAADKFTAHCSDSLTLACEVGLGDRVAPGVMVVVDDTYRPVRRQLHYAKALPGGRRPKYSTGNVAGLRKGLLISANGRTGILCGIRRNGGFRYYDGTGKRQEAKILAWISSRFVTRSIATT